CRRGVRRRRRADSRTRRTPARRARGPPLPHGSSPPARRRGTTWRPARPRPLHCRPLCPVPRCRPLRLPGSSYPPASPRRPPPLRSPGHGIRPEWGLYSRYWQLQHATHTACRRFPDAQLSGSAATVSWLACATALEAGGHVAERESFVARLRRDVAANPADEADRNERATW